MGINHVQQQSYMHVVQQCASRLDSRLLIAVFKRSKSHHNQT